MFSVVRQWLPVLVLGCIQLSSLPGRSHRNPRISLQLSSQASQHLAYRSIVSALHQLFIFSMTSECTLRVLISGTSWDTRVVSFMSLVSSIHFFFWKEYFRKVEIATPSHDSEKSLLTQRILSTKKQLVQQTLLFSLLYKNDKNKLFGHQ